MGSRAPARAAASRRQTLAPAPAQPASWPSLSSGVRGCFTQAASREVAGVLPLSSSLSVYRGQEGYMDQLSKKMQNETGLRDHHAHAWQVSCCPEQPRAAPNPEPRAPSATLAPALAALTT